MTSAATIRAMSVISPLGMTAAAHIEPLRSGHSGLTGRYPRLDGAPVAVGRLPEEPPRPAAGLEAWDSRNNRLLAALVAPLTDAIASAIERHGALRVGIVLGVTTSGIADSEPHYRGFADTGAWPAAYRYARQELGDPAAFAARLTGIGGPAYVVSTACTSGAKAMVSAAMLLEAGICDCVLCGGLDTLSALTINGFGALEALSMTPCLPFSRNRCGISIGEGGALFILDREPGALRLSGWGESCDAYHPSAPDPDGKGAAIAIGEALGRARIGAGDIDYVNLHGTGTRLNDQVESRVIERVLGVAVPCSSTKGATGHILGGAGACEAAFVALSLAHGFLPRHVWDGEADAELASINLVQREAARARFNHMMSCSYAFGGSNCVLVLARD